MIELDAEAIYRDFAQHVREAVAGRDVRLVGIHTGGVWLAERLREELKIAHPVGLLDISFYRDDFSRTGLNPSVKPSKIAFDVDGADILLIDDVLYTGRTIRAAMNELFDYGRATRIELAVLIDRGGRELPIAAAIVGRTLQVPADVSVVLSRDESTKLSLKLEQKGGH
jgi:pyrimidine operon attenuation protein/uracil phosphoribosyltransferase